MLSDIKFSLRIPLSMHTCVNVIWEQTLVKSWMTNRGFEAAKTPEWLTLIKTDSKTGSFYSQSRGKCFRRQQIVFIHFQRRKQILLQTPSFFTAIRLYPYLADICIKVNNFLLIILYYCLPWLFNHFTPPTVWEEFVGHVSRCRKIHMQKHFVGRVELRRGG